MASLSDRSHAGTPASSKFNHRLSAYAAAAGASLVAASTADAAIQFSGPQNIPLTSNPFPTFLPIDIDGGGYDLALNINPSFGNPSNRVLLASGGIYGNSVATVSYPVVPPPGNIRVANLAPSSSVGTNTAFGSGGVMASYFTSPGTNPTGPWNGPTVGYLGFKLAGNLNGWMKITITSPQLDLTVNEWAWETTPGAPIHVADIPEPSAVATLALGAVGVLARRRKKAG